MRIAYMLTSLGIGGAERQVVALAERMEARGHPVLMIVLQRRAEHVWPTHLSVVYLDMRKSIPGVVSGLLRGRRVLREFAPDLVHSHTFPANMIARMLRASGTSAKTISTIHNVYEGGWHRTLAYRLTDRLAVHTTAVSNAVATRGIQSGVVAQSKCSIIANGIDTALFAKDGARRDAMRTERNADSDFIWLAAGRITAAKDYPNLLRAFARVHAVIPQSRLWIAGEGSDPEEKRVRNLAIELGLANHIEWLGLREDMPAVFDGADAFVLGSAWEGMPLVVGEAMAMEKPVVATDVGGARELAGDSGTVVPSNNADELADGMLHVMRLPPAERNAVGRSARARICQYFDMNAKAAEWEALYARLLSDNLVDS